jgi:hypothetical protein
MSKIRIHEWGGQKREVEFVGYNRDHTACFIRNEQGDRRAIALHLPKRFDLHFREKPIGKTNSPPLQIDHVVLHPPACFASIEEKETCCNPNSDEAPTAQIMEHGNWKLISRHKHWLEPKHDDKLSEMLRHELNRLREGCAIREKEIAAQITLLRPEETERAEQLRNMLRNEFTFIVGVEDGGFKHVSVFDTTLDMVRQGYLGLREKLLEREWAEYWGMDLKAIPGAAAAFRVWLEENGYNARQRAVDLRDGSVTYGVRLDLSPSQWEVLEAGIMYEIRFADGGRCWLDDIQERDVTDAAELEDFDRFEAELISAEKVERLQQEAEIESKKEKNLAVEAQLEAGRRHNLVEEARRVRQRAMQPVSRQQVREALKVKTDRGVRNICQRHNVAWPETQGELDQLQTKHLRHKRHISEATAKRNRQRAGKRQDGPIQ